MIGGGISPKGHFTPENVVKFWQNPLHAPGFLGIFAYLWIFSSIGGRGGTDINWNHPRRCGSTLGDVWVEIQLPEKFCNLLFSNCMGGKFIVLTYRKQSSRNSIR